ncbi:MAG: glycosyltransferase family 2 protein [Candidatus Chisholmbacteria bacterium]|nr:glycosyltransferase family 2 protein [Candidatus Chisholmbacteria bacterium]
MVIGKKRTKSGITLSAVVACYRDGQAIPIMYRRLKAVFKALKVDFEIVFVNDGSPDDSKMVLAKITAADPRVMAVNHSRNFGSQSAFTSGMMVANGDAVVLLDGDLQDPPELIPKLFKKWQAGFDVVYGIRVKRVASPFMQWAYKAFYRIFRATSYIPMPLDAGDFSLLDKKVVQALNSLPESNRFIRGLRSWVGFRQTGVPYKRPERMFGQTTNSLMKNLWWAQKAIFSFSYLPIELVTATAFVVMVLTFGLLVMQLVIRIFWPELTPSGLTTLISLVLFLGGMQLFGLGIIGAYIAHIHEESKRRPPFIVESFFRKEKRNKSKS